MMDNYPDDIRAYDKHPDSPFYVEPPQECNICEDKFDPEDMTDDMCVECFNQFQEDNK
jgi:hypothetical protein